jgi:hypothetical protein
VRIEAGNATVRRGAAEAAFSDVLEMAVRGNGNGDRVSLTFWQDGLPIEAIPREGAFEVSGGGGWNG